MTPPARIPGQERPSSKSVQTWFRQVWDSTRSRRELDEKLRSRVYRQYTPDGTGPNGEGRGLHQTTIRSGILRTLLREMTGILNSESPRVEALTDGIGPKANEKASAIENWSEAWWLDVDGDDIQELVDQDMLAYGRGVSITYWSPESWGDMPERAKDEQAREYNRRMKDYRRSAPNPTAWIHCPAPQTLVEDDLWVKQYGPTRACYWEHRRMSQVALDYPDSDAGKKYHREFEPHDEDPLVLFITFANRKWITYGVAQGVVAEAEDTNGKVALLHDALTDWEIVVEPFEHELCRNAFIVQYGEVTGDRDPVHKHAGIFDNSLELVDNVDAVLSQYATMVRRYSRAMLTIERAPVQVGGQFVIYGVDDETGEAREITWDPDEVLNLLPGEKASWTTPPMEQFRAAIELHTLLSQYVSRDTLAPSSWGGGTATESGFQLVTLIQAAERKLKPLIRRKQRAIEDLLANVYSLAIQLGGEEGLTLVRRGTDDDGDTDQTGGLVTLTPRLARSARCLVTLSPKLDSAEAANMQLGIQIAQVVASGALDLDGDWILRRFFGQSNPERHRQKALLQRFLRSPDLLNWLTQYVLKKAEMTLQEEEAQEVGALAKLAPEELLLAPNALQAALAARGLVPGAPGAAPPGETPGALAPQGPGGDGGLAALLSGAAPGVGGPPVAAGGQGAPQMAAGQQGPGQLQALMSAAQSGQPASPRLAGI